MWMNDTTVTRISATIFHKHKYTTNPSVTPEDYVMATSGKLADKVKVRMSTHISKTSLHQLEQLGTILKQGWVHQEKPTRDPSNCTAKIEQKKGQSHYNKKSEPYYHYQD